MPPPTRAVLGVFAVSSLKGIDWNKQVSMASPTVKETLPLEALFGVGKVAFGWYSSPNYISPALSIPATAHRRPDSRSFSDTVRINAADPLHELFAQIGEASIP